MALAMITAALVAAPGSSAYANTDYLYWTDQDSGTIERSALDGSGRETFLAGRNNPSALTSDGTYLYWSEWRGDGEPQSGIFRALLSDPSSATQLATTLSLSYGIAVTATHLYWSESWTLIGGPTNVVRANLDGTGRVNFVTGLTNPYGLTVNATHLYVSEFGANNRVVRVDLDGVPPVTASLLVAPGGAAGVDDVAVDSTYLFWAQSNAGRIGRSLLDGTESNAALVGADSSRVSGLTVFGSKLYWTRYLNTASGGGIWSANLDGTGITQLVSESGLIDVIVVAASQSPPNESTSVTFANFSFHLPDGRECSAVSPMRVQVGAVVELPGQDANCRTMPGSKIAGWTIPVAPGYVGAGSRSLPLGPGERVRVVDSQRFTAVLGEPIVTIIYEANVRMEDACTPSTLEHVSADSRQGFSWVPREAFALARTWGQAPCTPPGHRIVAWSVAGDGTGQRLDLGARLPESWETDPSNVRRLYAVWQRS
jgi:sugar lactone lactonase YvrE